MKTNTTQKLLPYLLLFALPCLLLLFSQLGSLGIWEPWEAQEVLVAMEYQNRAPFDASVIEQNPSASGYNWAVPTLDQKPVAKSLLKIWLISALLPASSDDIREVVGTLERNARLPFALLTLALITGLFFWLKRHFSTRQAALSALAMASMPVIFLGSHNLSIPLLFVVTSSGALIALFELAQNHSQKHKWLLSLLLLACLAMGAFDQRLISLYLVLAVFAGFSLIEIPFNSKDLQPSKKDILLATGVFITPALALLWMLITSSSYAALVKTLSAPYAQQLLLLFIPLTSIASALLLARKTKTAQSFMQPQVLLPLLVTAALIVLIGHAYGEVNPTLLKRGKIFGEIPSLGYLLGNHVHADSLARQHYRLDIWFRQIGFATFPWAALIPAGLAHLARNLKSPSLAKADLEIDPASSTAQAQRFLLAWAFIALFVMAAASTQNHYFYPAILPLAASCGILLGDSAFWKFVRRARPIYPYLVGMTAVAVILTLGKDLERYPHRFIEVYAQMPKKLELPEGFSWGKTYKPFKYIMLLTIIGGFFGPISWAILQFESLDKLKARFVAWRKKESPLFAPITPEDSSPLEERTEKRTNLILGTSTPEKGLSKLALPLAKLVEHPSSRAVLVALVFTGFALATLFSYIHQATYHLSQRHIFESYLESSQPDEKLMAYQIPKTQTSLYLQDVKSTDSTRELINNVKESQRFYAVIPRDKLANLNMYTRRELKHNLYVLNANSNKLVLISNQIKDNEEDQNFISSHIIDPTDTLPKEIQHPVTYKDAQGNAVHATFDDQLEFLGYSLNKQGTQAGKQSPLYRWGDNLDMTLYFRVKKRVTGNQQLFVHVDTSGNRLHGDHYPVNGDFPTNTWLPGDIVKDTHTIPVESYTKAGTYSLNFGFYMGKKRMKIEPQGAHRKDNRIKIGEIRVRR